MSADNGIYILQTKDGFRVSHAQAIDNITYQADETGFNLRQLYKYFHNADFFLSREKALSKAAEIYEDIMKDDYCPIVEYGICPINASNIEFPKECPACCNNPIVVYIDGNNRCYNCGEYLDY